MSSVNSNAALAVRAFEGSENKTAYQILLVGLGVLAIAISAHIKVPFWPVPMTLQTLAIMGIYAAYGMRLSVATILAYLAAGFMGLPVFASGAGPGYFVGPTAGFLAGFVVAAFIVGAVADRVGSSKPFALFGAMVAADFVVFVLGFVWLAFIFTTGEGKTLGAAFAWEKGVYPFILSDIVKMVLVAAIVPAIGLLLKR